MSDRMSFSIYRGKKILITGHTGFKGSWLTLWLTQLGADVYGYALEPPTHPSLYQILNVENNIQSEVKDIRNREALNKSVRRIKPDLIFHLAAQSLVRESYLSPVETVEVNTIGSVNIMDAVHKAGAPTALIMVTTDKCYENKEWLYGYKETDPIGGYDPYSASKGAAEVLISSWRNSFFNPELINEHGVRLASVRAGNVIGGGDWTRDALIPDCIRALVNEETITIRNPNATRPWQHVLEPLSGYLQLGARLLQDSSEGMNKFCSAFNFGPYIDSNKPVRTVVEKVIEQWGSGSWIDQSSDHSFHEASLLHLSFDKAYHELNWKPRWSFNESIARTVDWYKTYIQSPLSIKEFTLNQIQDFQKDTGILLENDSVKRSNLSLN